jgi:hypothetical protein
MPSPTVGAEAVSVGASVGVDDENVPVRVEHASIKTSRVVKSRYFFILSPLDYSLL